MNEMFGLTRFSAHMDVGGPSHAMLMKSIEIFGAKIAPKVREALAKKWCDGWLFLFVDEETLTSVERAMVLCLGKIVGQQPTITWGSRLAHMKAQHKTRAAKKLFSFDRDKFQYAT